MTKPSNKEDFIGKKSRVEKRREERHQRILRIAARHFAEEGVEVTRLEQIAEEADIAKGTLYSHFPSKEALVKELLFPAMEYTIETIKAISLDSPPKAVEGIIRLYLQLWARYPDEIRIAHRFQNSPVNELSSLRNAFIMGVVSAMQPEGSMAPPHSFPHDDLASLHSEFFRGMFVIFRCAEEAGILRMKAALAMRTLSIVAVPMLELFEAEENRDQLFTDSLSSLLLTSF